MKRKQETIIEGVRRPDLDPGGGVIAIVAPSVESSDEAIRLVGIRAYIRTRWGSGGGSATLVGRIVEAVRTGGEQHAKLLVEGAQGLPPVDVEPDQELAFRRRHAAQVARQVLASARIQTDAFGFRVVNGAPNMDVVAGAQK